MNQASSTENPLVISYLTLRKAVGFLGIILPFVLIAGGSLLHHTGMQASISGYYYTAMRDVLVGTLCAYGVFLACYKGYGHEDDLAADLAGICAIGIAFFPTTTDDASHRQKMIGVVHVVFTSLFFLILSYISLKLFTKTDSAKNPTDQKRQRNRVYRACGYTMLTAMVLIVAMSLLPDHILAEIKKYNPTFWLETIAIEAFGISWFTKGEAILKDKTETVTAESPAV